VQLRGADHEVAKLARSSPLFFTARRFARARGRERKTSSDQAGRTPKSTIRATNRYADTGNRRFSIIETRKPITF
jgi:hypothetical protein